jgi:hypothetical protein
MVAIVFLVQLGGHLLGDWVAQTDRQATNKTRSRAALAAHVDCYHLIAGLLLLLLRIVDNPVVALNHAVAVAMVRGPHAGLDLLGKLEADERVAGDHRLHAVRAHCWRWPATPWRRATPTWRRPGRPPASHSSATFTPRLPASLTTSDVRSEPVVPMSL